MADKKLVHRVVYSSVFIARQLLQRPNFNECYIFPGTGMRPLFETFQGLKSINPTVQGRRALYLIPPSRITTSKQHRIDWWVRSFRNKKFVRGSGRKYVIVDVENTGQTIDNIRDAILRLDPNAHLEVVSTGNSNIDSHLFDINNLPRGHTKEGKNVLPVPSTYFRFQRLLRKYLLHMRKYVAN